MAEVAEKLLTFEEYTALNSEPLYELVAGRLERLPHAGPLHGRTKGRLVAILDGYLRDRNPEGFVGPSLDIPTLPAYGRTPDLAYYSEEAASLGIDWVNDRVTGLPTLAAEILSPEDEQRDTVTKREEYACVGIAHYWIIDPQREMVLTLRLHDGEYLETRRFSGTDVLTSGLFPGLEIPLPRLFR